MQASRLLIVLVALALGVSAEAIAKKGSARHTTAHGTADSHAAPGTGVSLVKNIGTKGSSSDDTSPSTPGTPSPGTPQKPGGSDNDKTKAADNAELARKIEMAAAEAQKKQLAEQAAAAAAEANRQREAESREQQRQAALLAQDQRQAAWIARCNIQPVMTDLAIATCREVMTRPAP